MRTNPSAVVTPAAMSSKNRTHSASDKAPDAPQNADSRFTRCAMERNGNGSRLATLATNTNSGVPGECGMPSVYAEAMNSPESQKLALASMVRA
jgi:hypothetical protein